MLSEKEQRLLIKKKKIELNALGIDSIIYYHVDKLLNKECRFIYKNDTPHVFKDSKEIDDNDLTTLIKQVFSLKSSVAEMIICEWTRDRIIYHNMMENQNKCFDYLSLPLPYDNNDDEGFNF